MKYSKNQHGVLPAVPGTPRLRGVGMIRRLLLAVHIRCLEATADGRTQVQALVADPAARERMLLAQANLLLEITRLKREGGRGVRGGGLTSC